MALLSNLSSITALTLLAACTAASGPAPTGRDNANVSTGTGDEGSSLNETSKSDRTAANLATYRLAPLPKGAVRNEVGLQGVLRIQNNCVTVEVDSRIKVIPVFPIGTATLTNGQELVFRQRTFRDGDAFTGSGFQSNQKFSPAQPDETPIPVGCEGDAIFFLTG